MTRTPKQVLIDLGYDPEAIKDCSNPELAVCFIEILDEVTKQLKKLI